MAEEPPASTATKPPDPPPDPQEAAYRALHAERAQVERDLTLAQQRQRFGANADEIEQARLSEETLLKDLDRVLTLIRAAEVRRKSGSAARRWR